MFQKMVLNLKTYFNVNFLFLSQLERSFKFMRETEDQLKVIPQFCFPDAKDWAPVDSFPRSVQSCPAKKKFNKTGTLEIPDGVVKAQLFSWLVTTCRSRKKTESS